MLIFCSEDEVEGMKSALLKWQNEYEVKSETHILWP